MCIEPEVGQVTEDPIESQSKVPWHVLQERDAGSYFVKHSSDFRPQVALVVFAELLAGEAERLARVARSDEIHDATPGSAVEGAEVVPDRRVVEHAVSHPPSEDTLGEGLALDPADGPVLVPECELHPEFEPADAGT